MLSAHKRCNRANLLRRVSEPIFIYARDLYSQALAQLSKKSEFIAFWSTGGAGEKCVTTKGQSVSPAPPYTHLLRRSGRSPALPYPPNRRE